MKFYLIKILIIICIVCFTGCFTEKQKRISSSELFTVIETIDGDTFRLSNGEKVRLLGIDAPEMNESDKLERDSEQSGRDKNTIKKLGTLSARYVKKLAEGKKVYLEKEPGGDNRDRYGRLLRYVYLEDGTLINRKIIRDGYAYVYDRYPLSKTEEFKQYEKEARENERGLWGEIEGLEQF
ncbi:MAG: thermonuclease family protein [Ignavibacteria bacterium]|nr:thermonuclease family protein [Ignavibacteria bacterium]